MHKDDDSDSGPGSQSDDSEEYSSESEVEESKIKDSPAFEKEKEFEHKFYWTSCCIRMDKRAISYFSQMLFSAVIIAFCISMLVSNQDCATFSRYSPLLTFVIGYLMPQPNLKRD